MIIFGILIVITAVCIVMTARYGSDGAELLAYITGVTLAIALILWPIIYYGTVAEVERYHVLKETVELSRSNDKISDVERAAVTTQIAEYNKDLASVKYWNNTIFDVFIYDGLAELEYLE